MVRKCEYATSGKGGLKRHIKAVHDKIKDDVCDECGYVTSEKAVLRKIATPNPLKPSIKSPKEALKENTAIEKKSKKSQTSMGRVSLSKFF